MQRLKLDYSNAQGFFDESNLTEYGDRIRKVHDMLHKRTGPGKEYLGWVNLPVNYDKDELESILSAAQEIRSSSDILIVIGIGGSYLGARAAIQALNHTFYNLLRNSLRMTPKVYFVGNSVSSTYLAELTDILIDKDISVNVISKSGTTTEPAIAFRYFKDFMENKYGRRIARKRIYVTTDSTKGALRKMAEEEGYESFSIPDDIGGRYSVLTAAGLLPIAVTNANIEEVMEGAADAYEAYLETDIEKNDCYMYAAIRNILKNKGKDIEILASYEPYLHYFAEWWKQLFGESEGKEGNGIFPASADLTTDLHSLGQYIQDGKRNIFETVINITKPKREITIEEQEGNTDGLDYLEGKTMDYVNKKAMEGTVIAHTDGAVPNLMLNVPRMNSYYFGQMVYFFEKACGASGYLLGVNPFNQPGVEAYKNKMFKLLGKPGFKDK